MVRRVFWTSLAAALLTVAGLSLPAQAPAQAPPKADAESARAAYDTYRSMLQSSPYRSLVWQYLGPTNISGRATDIAVADRGGARRIYAAYATSGVWKTDDDGASWQAVFENQAVDEHRRYRGSAVQPRYRLGRDRRVQPVSRLDAWRRRLQVDRRRPHVPAQRPNRHADDCAHRRPSDAIRTSCTSQPAGHGWTDNETRGVFKTIDGGRTWTKVLYRSPRTGAIDLVMDPSDPEHAVRRDVAACPPQVERSASRTRIQRERHPQKHRRRHDMVGCERRTASGAVPRTHRDRRVQIESERVVCVRRQLRGRPSSARERAGRLRTPDRREPYQGRGDLSNRRQGSNMAQGERQR